MKYVKCIVLIICLCFLITACKKACTHQYQSEITQKAGCEQVGVETFTCTLCGDSHTKPIPALEHSFAPAVVEKEPTCSEEGIRAYTCSACGTVKTEPIEKLTHTFGESSVTKEPNCSEEGERSATCSVCGVNQVVEKIPTNEIHVFSNTILREATCTSPGEGVNTCTLCQYSERCEYPQKEHTYDNGEIKTAPTCTGSGTRVRTCTGCGQTLEEQISATGHNWSKATCITASTCSACGTQGSKAEHQYITLEDRSPLSMFAGRRDQQCEICGKERTLYYGNNYTYDLEAIRNELMEYAKSLGFQVVLVEPGSEFKMQYHYNVLYTVVDLPGFGPDRILNGGKVSIDVAYRDYASSPCGIERYTLLIEAHYYQSSQVGGGFSVQFQVTS